MKSGLAPKNLDEVVDAKVGEWPSRLVWICARILWLKSQELSIHVYTGKEKVKLFRLYDTSHAFQIRQITAINTTNAAILLHQHAKRISIYTNVLYIQDVVWRGEITQLVRLLW